MSVLTCANCGGTTNTAVCDFFPLREDHKAHKCYAKFVDGKWVKGCAYSECDPYTRPGVQKLISEGLQP